MIAIQLNKKDFEYDLHSLVRSFYPGEEVSVIYREELVYETITEQELIYEELAQEMMIHKNAWLFIQVTYEKYAIGIVFYKASKASEDDSDNNPAYHKVLGERVELDYDRDRKETKNILKRLLYGMMAEYSGKTLSWGTLTGIRPIKIPIRLLEEDKKNVEIARHLRETYLLSNEKTALSIAIANRELDILKNIDYKDGYSLYIGIPFCPSICLYCSFSSYPLSMYKNKVDAYLDALFQEIDFVSKEFKDKKLNTIYIGGGTPTTLEAHQLDALLTKISISFSKEYLAEFTVEAGRPDSVSDKKLQVLKKHNVTRISVNPQTMKQETLDIIGRRHTVEDTIEAFWLARECGFDNINMDLIVGLPGEDAQDVKNTLDALSIIDPDSITVHTLAVKRASRLNTEKEKYKELDSVNNQEIMNMAANYARTLGMAPYYLYRQKNMTGNFENVGYAKPDKAGIYNILIMEEKQTIIALGAGGATKLVYPGSEKIQRVENVKDVQTYITRINDMIDRKRNAFSEYFRIEEENYIGYDYTGTKRR